MRTFIFKELKWMNHKFLSTHINIIYECCYKQKKLYRPMFSWYLCFMYVHHHSYISLTIYLSTRSIFLFSNCYIYLCLGKAKRRREFRSFRQRQILRSLESSVQLLKLKTGVNRSGFSHFLPFSVYPQSTIVNPTFFWNKNI